MTKELLVFIGGVFCGYLRQNDIGQRSFTYDAGYAGPALSLSMPPSNKPYGQKQVDAFLLGLLPDNEDVRRSVAQRVGGSPNNPLTLLERMGLDCPGAVQICLPEEAGLIGSRGEELVPLNEGDIAERLRPESEREVDTWYAADEERWSLGGNQEKFALRWQDGRWYECWGSAATTHIFKPGVRGMRLEALNEYACMKLSALCGLPSEEVEYRLFCDVPAVIATRYDRMVEGQVVRRLHQEDACQALSVIPSLKYAQDGGPNTQDLLGLMRRLSNPQQSIEAFTRALFWNYALGAPDAHAKNYSIVHLPNGDDVLAPLYDIATILPYERHRQEMAGTERPKPIRLAMSIGGENRVGMLERKHLERYADAAGLDRAWCVDLMATLCIAVIEHLPDAFAEVRGLPGAELMEERFTERLVPHCKHTVLALGE